jgi:NDP-sugar pyrophosphorylase family protein
MNYAILAAGEGSRLVQEGIALPKPLVDLDGRPMIKRLIDIFIDNDAEQIAIIVNEYMTDVREYVESLDLPVPIKLVVKTTAGSMHSFYEVSRLFDAEDAKFILTTVDTIFRPEEFARYARAFADDDSADGYMAVTSFIDDEKPLYIDVDDHGIITAFRDAPNGSDRYISGGIYGLRPAAVRILERCMSEGVTRMRHYQRALVESGQRLVAYPFDKIIDVDHAADIKTAQQFLAQ